MRNKHFQEMSSLNSYTVILLTYYAWYFSPILIRDNIVGKFIWNLIFQKYSTNNLLKCVITVDECWGWRDDILCVIAEYIVKKVDLRKISSECVLWISELT